MAAVIEKEKAYRPTTGEEAIDLILNEFHKQLVNSGIFPLHRVWHEFEIQGGVRVKGWSTKTEEVKFVVTLEGPAKGDVLLSERETTEEVSERVDVRIVPQPPDILRESLPEFPCPKCGRVFRSKPSMSSHLTVWCKKEVAPPAPEIKDEVPVRTDNSNLPASDTGQSEPDKNPDAGGNVHKL